MTEDYRHKTIINTMTESVQEAAVLSTDKSSRVTDGLVILDKPEFEGNFKRLFDKNNNVKLGSETFSFNYLIDGQQFKAVRVVLKDDRGTHYQVTCVSNVSN